MKTGIVACAFGTPETIFPNKLIGVIATNEARQHNAPVYTQRDVPISPDIEVVLTEEVPGEPPPTLRIARGAVKWAEIHGITMFIAVCAGPHLWRVERDLKAAVREAKAKIEVIVSSQIARQAESIWFDATSTQPRTASKKAWRKRERILEKIPFFLYKRIAS